MLPTLGSLAFSTLGSPCRKTETGDSVTASRELLTFIKEQRACTRRDIYDFEWMKWSHVGLIHSPGSRVAVPPHLQHPRRTLEGRLSVHQPPEQETHTAQGVHAGDRIRPAACSSSQKLTVQRWRWWSSLWRADRKSWHPLMCLWRRPFSLRHSPPGTN